MTTPTPTSSSPGARYLPPTSRLDLAFNASVAWLTDHGISLLGSRVLTVRGRKTGALQRVPVNLLTLGDERYLVAVRGNTQWVRNVRAAGEAELRVGRRTERVAMTVVPVDERLPVIRVYLMRWGWEVGRFIEGLTKDSDDATIIAAAPGFPVFRVASLAG
ncbi:nitroreductase family deazaflavin-dependent oxidoreductase [Lapillicoccus sp.]|uniref:nitroreductase family deazaflavin-dependent oxidoreductase n=1 Tax=Lapillicoccus sp. TaxID=1909287 RepID=UPI0025F8F6EC|nr:nitroreductase family deazaflavin-dependent oxidoreductase [Lapillicoccus sp.]